MHASVVIRTKDEADRLRLTLASLSVQTETAEVVVVNDGSTDHTATVIAEAAKTMDLVPIHHESPKGRSGAANAGACRANGDVMIFLDGDTLAAPDFVSHHLSAHRQTPMVVARGETLHLRCTRSFLDPESGSPRPGEEAKLARMAPAELARMRVSRQDIITNFQSIDERAQAGVYPGAGPRLLFDLEMEALRSCPDSGILWAAASGSNQSVWREAFLATGGFHPELSINEHRELALRLCQAGHRMNAVGGRTYHLTHRSGWRDPLVDTAWEDTFYGAHPIPVVPLLSVFWASLGDPVPFPSEARILSLPRLEAAAARCAGIWGIQEVREAHFRAVAATLPGVAA